MKYALVYDLLYPYSFGGVEKRVWQIACGLAQRGHEVRLFGTKEWHGPSIIARSGVTLVGIGSTTRKHATGGRRSVWQGVSFAFGLMRKLRRERFDLVDVQSMSPLSCLITVVTCRLSGTPVLVTWHEVWLTYWREYLGPVGRVGSAVEKLIAVLADAHIAVSHSTAAKLQALGVKDVAVVPNGVDIEAVKAVDRSFEQADIVYVGRLAAHKQVDVLIDAIRILRDRGTGLRVALIGDGPDRAALMRRASDMDGVRFLGRVDSDPTVWSMLKSCSMFASASTREGFGLAVLEALACGVPCVISDHSANAATELVVHGVNGLVVDGSPQEFADAILSLLSDDKSHDEMSENARSTARDYDLPQIVDLIESSYRSFSYRGESDLGDSSEIRTEGAR